MLVGLPTTLRSKKLLLPDTLLVYVLCSVVAKITKVTVVLQLIFLFNRGVAQVTGFMLYPSQVVSYIYKWTPGHTRAYAHIKLAGARVKYLGLHVPT